MFHCLLKNHLILQRAAQMKRLEIIPTRKQNKSVSHFTSWLDLPFTGNLGKLIGPDELNDFIAMHYDVVL